MKYLSTFEVAEKWGISPRRVGILCNNDRIPGAQRAGSRWIIPADAEKPTDARIKSGKYIKQKADRQTEGSIMADTYLPADVRKRIIDVMRERKLTQRELALRIDVNESTISRFLSGKTEKLSEESVIRIARVFNVSTDFILGTTVIPDKKNYDISELGLSVEAAKNLYTGKVNNDVVNRLLENPRFATVTYMIAQHLDDTLAGGYAAQNQMFATVGSLLLGQNQTPEAVQAARTANAMKVPTYQADQTTIQNTFMTVVKEIKKEAGSDLAAARAI